jgi:hypothetical protein
MRDTGEKEKSRRYKRQGKGRTCFEEKGVRVNTGK